jgi:poly-gamma-glutamate synthesis protein (capsule biosynthesis protein)
MNSKITIAATGDSIITRPISIYKEKEFLSILKVIRDADVGFTNFEVVAVDYREGYPGSEYGGSYLVVEPSIVKEFKWAGFNMVARANNHSVDWGYEGLFASSRALDDIGIVHAGVGRDLGEARSPAYLETEKGRVALISSNSSVFKSSVAGEARFDVQGRPGVNPLRCKTEIRVTKDSLQKIKSIVESVGAKMAIGPITENEVAVGVQVYRGSVDPVRFVGSDKPEYYTEPYEPDLKGNIRSIKDAKRQAKIVLVSHHGHQDDGSDRHKPARFIETYARACIDAGADAFLSHGAHVLRGIEIYKGKPIIYSMGNFIFQLGAVKKLGQDVYDKYNLDTQATPADLFDADAGKGEKNWKGWKRHDFEKAEWDTFIAEISFNDGELADLKFHPSTNGYGLPRFSHKRGRPIRTSKKDTDRIIDFVAKYSKPYRTMITNENGLGVVEL